jgi:adenylate cyclase
MAVFEHPQQAVDAGQQACRAVAMVEVAGHRPELRVGSHVGRPRRRGGDYFGVDVNVAARIAAAAAGGEVLVSERLVPQLDTDRVALRQRRRFTAKGTPAGLRVFSAEPAAALG